MNNMSNQEIKYTSGDIIGENYQVQQALIGRMSEIYFCLTLEDSFPIVLKSYRKDFLKNHKLRDAFESEIYSWISLGIHPHIVRCYSVKSIENQRYLCLQWVHSNSYKGSSLRSWLLHNHLNLKTTLTFAFDICNGLIHAQKMHSGFVHGDLKPENILIQNMDVAMITDFGLAKIISENSKKKILGSGIGLNNIAGTPPYMAPELWLGESADQQTDIYSIGCLLFEMLSGSPLFVDNTIDKIQKRHLKFVVHP